VTVYFWLAAMLLGPVAAVAAAQALAERRLGNKITAYGWAGLAAYFLAGQLARLVFGVTVWSLVAGLVAAIALGVGFRVAAKRQRR
jgi:hypothetical protein